MPAVGLTDHGSLAGAVQLYQHAAKVGVKPLIGCEVYVCDDASKQEKGYAHLTLLAESNEGYGNLIKLASAGYLQGYYYKPRVDWSLLETHAKGLIALSGLPLGTRLEGARGVTRGRRGFRPRPARPGLRARLDLRRDPERGPLRAGADQPAAGEARRRHRPAARRDRRRALPAPRRRARARGAALHPVGRLAQEPVALEVRHRPVLLQDAGRDGAGLRRVSGRVGADPRDRRAVPRRDRARDDPAPEVPGAGGSRRVRLPRRAL